MKHYGISQWVDFARGLTTGSDPVEMREHAARCEDCRNIADYCSKLARVSIGMMLDEIPQAAVRSALSVFPVTTPPKRSFRLPAQLVYDSFLVPVPAGLRATWQVGWQALYHAGDCSLDLRIEPDVRSSRASVIGQISNHSAPDCRMADIPVCLKSGRLVIAETRSNQFGEFQMEYEQQKRLDLCVYLEGGAKSIQVPLKKLQTEKPVAADRLGAGQSRKRQPAGRQK